MTPSEALARVVVDELARCRVTDVVLCPGSRSAPLAYALLDLVRARRMRLHVRIDERSAAFLALGLGKATGRPAAVVTTSGTAVVNLHPAVLEAHEAGVPLLLLTADRPPELRGTRANQTTDQAKLFSDAVRWFHDFGAPERRPGQQAAWRTVVDRAVAAATGALGADPGPVHLNVPLRDPLVPELPAAANGTWPEPLDGRPASDPWTRVPARAWNSAVADPSGGPGALHGQERTLVVLGDLCADAYAAQAPGALSRQVLRFAAARGWPVVAEPFGAGCRPEAVPHGPLVLSVPGLLTQAPPERIVLVGRITLSRDIAALLQLPGVRVEAVTDRARWSDPGHVIDAVHPWSVLEADAPPDAPANPGWLQRWRRAAAALHELVAQRLPEQWGSPADEGAEGGEAGASGGPSGPSLADAVLRGVPQGATLFLGSSNAARDVELARGPAGPFVVGSRGLAGIDGCVSTAAGMALGAPGTPSYALVGDLTFLHDANALLIGPGEARPDLTVVVADDSGGGIFATLEYGEPGRRSADPQGYERVFATPGGADIGALCGAYGVAYERVRSRARLLDVLGTPPRGLRVVHVPIRRDAHRSDYAALRELAAQVDAGAV